MADRPPFTRSNPTFDNSGRSPTLHALELNIRKFMADRPYLNCSNLTFAILWPIALILLARISTFAILWPIALILIARILTFAILWPIALILIARI